MMCTFILAAHLMSGPAKSVTPADGTLVSARLAVANIATVAGFVVSMPGKAPVGYALSVVDYLEVAGQPVVRLNYINRAAKSSFDLVESPSQAGTKPAQKIKGIIESNELPISMDEGQTCVYTQKGKVDVGLIGGLLSTAAAKHVLATVVPVKPQ